MKHMFSHKYNRREGEKTGVETRALRARSFTLGTLLTTLTVALVIAVSTISFAGSLTPPGAPANTMYTLTDLYNLSTGATTTEGSGAIPATPGTATGTMKTLTEVYNALEAEVTSLPSTTLKVGTTAFGEVGTIYGGGMLKTGQTTCYDAAGATTTCAGTGQDGELQMGSAKSYTDNSDGTITDNQTGLTWQKGTTTTYTWVAALEYCGSNTPSLPGSGWRLPQVKELFSLVDFTVTSQAKINLTYFPSTPTSSFWSATTYPVAGSGGNAMSVLFNAGRVYNDSKTLISNYVRCVRE